MRKRKKTKTKRSIEPETPTLDGDGRLAPVVVDELDEWDALEEEHEVASSKPAAKPQTLESLNAVETKGSEISDVIVGPSEAAGRGEWPVDLSKVDVVRERKSTFIVFIDQDLRLRWLAAFSPSELADESQDIIARARLVAATPTTYFKEAQQKAWMRMIGESLALALSGDVQNSKRTLSMAESFVASRARETARLWYVKASLTAFVVLAVSGVLLSLVPLLPQVSESASWFDKSIGIAILFGAVGSQFSVLLRLNTLNVDPGAGRDAHYVEAVVRILLGVFAAVIAVVAVQADIILGFMKNSGDPENKWLIPTVALLAGTSERFVPGILRGVETTTLEKESMVDGEHLTDEQRSDSKANEPTDTNS